MDNKKVYIKFANDTEITKEILTAVEENNGYCPCKLDKNKDTLCMCKEFRDFKDRHEIGTCSCGLYQTYYY